MFSKIAVDAVSYRVVPSDTIPLSSESTSTASNQRVYEFVGAGQPCLALRWLTTDVKRSQLTRQCGLLENYLGIPGLVIADRKIPESVSQIGLGNQNLATSNAITMPWIEGPTWQQILAERRPFSSDESHPIAQSLLHTLATMEEERLAHRDLCGPNLMLPLLADGEGIELVDLETMYGPGVSANLEGTYPGQE